MSKIADKLRQNLAANVAAHRAAQGDVRVDVERRMTKVRVDACIPSPFQVRRNFDLEAIESLAATISEAGGLHEPIIVRPVANDQYEIVAGERRWRAHKLLGWTSIDAVVRDIADDESGRIGVIENIQREQLSDYETYLGILVLERDQIYQKKADLAVHLGMARQEIYRYKAFAVLPEFVIEDLEKKPELMTRKTADLLKRYFSDGSPYPKDRVLKEMKSLWEAIKSGKLKQAALPAALENRLKTTQNERNASAEKNEIIREGKTIGFFERKGDVLHMKVDASRLSPSRQEKLKDFIETLLDEEARDPDRSE